MNRNIIDLQDVKTIKKCRMSIPGIKKAMVLQIVLPNDVYTSEIIQDVENVSKKIWRMIYISNFQVENYVSIENKHLFFDTTSQTKQSYFLFKPCTFVS